MLTGRHFLRLFLLGLAVLASAGLASAGIKSPRLLARIAQHTPQAQLVEKGEEMAHAEKEALRTGGETLWGVGRSMEPLYAPGTAIVVKRMDYDDIKKGMTVVYRKTDGRLVAHTVVGEDGHGYVVQGINNDRPDEVSVNEKNLVGVITAAYSAAVFSGRALAVAMR